MNAKFKHLNIVAKNWRKLADFYIKVFGCIEKPPKRKLSGQWLADGTAVRNAALEGVHLRLPGFGENGPTLEVFSYGNSLDKPESAANRLGYGHLAFEVEDVNEVLQVLIRAGGRTHGQVVQKEVGGGWNIGVYLCRGS